jgi:hypothetical protein
VELFWTRYYKREKYCEREENSVLLEHLRVCIWQKRRSASFMWLRITFSTCALAKFLHTYIMFRFTVLIVIIIIIIITETTNGYKLEYPKYQIMRYRVWCVAWISSVRHVHTGILAEQKSAVIFQIIFKLSLINHDTFDAA